MIPLALVAAALAQDEPVEITAGGTLRTTTGLWMERLDTEPWARARQSVDLFVRSRQDNVRTAISGHAELDLKYVMSREDHDAATFEAYGRQAALRELLVGAHWDQVELVVGRQLVVWGEGVLITPLDVVAARDTREPGLADIDDIRLPVTAVTVAWTPGRHRVEAMAVPELDWGFRPSPMGPYSLVPGLLEESGALRDPALAQTLAERELVWTHDRTRFAPDQMQAFARWRYSGRVDLAVYAGALYDKGGNLALPDPAAIPRRGDIELQIAHDAYQMVGHSGAAAVRSFLLKWELGVDIGRAFDVGDPALLGAGITTEEATLVNGMVGARYDGIAHTTIDAELGLGRFPDKPEALIFPVDMALGALRVAHLAWRDRIRSSVNAIGFGEDLRYGGLVRAEVTVEATTGLRVGAGAMVYRPGSERGPLLGLDEHDQAYVQLRYDF